MRAACHQQFMKRPVIWLVLAWLATTGSPADPIRIRFPYEGRERTAYACLSTNLPPESSAPLVLLLHGSGQGGRAMARLWEPTARQAGFVAVAPDARDLQAWHGVHDGPGFLREAIEAVVTRQRIDPRRIYLFGYSGGAHFGIQMALAESEYFAAAAFYAGELRPEQAAVIQLARRKIPIMLFAGNDDRVVPPDRTRAAARMLEECGFPATFSLLRGWSHDYANGAHARLHRDVWRELQIHRLDQEPRFQPIINAAP